MTSQIRKRAGKKSLRSWGMGYTAFAWRRVRECTQPRSYRCQHFVVSFEVDAIPLAPLVVTIFSKSPRREEISP